MPQMSPLMWMVLSFFFIICYLVLSVVIYYQFYFNCPNSSVGLEVSKFLILFN